MKQQGGRHQENQKQCRADTGGATEDKKTDPRTRKAMAPANSREATGSGTPLDAMPATVPEKSLIFPGTAAMNMDANARRPSRSKSSVVINETLRLVWILLAEQLQRRWIVRVVGELLLVIQKPLQLFGEVTDLAVVVLSQSFQKFLLIFLDVLVDRFHDDKRASDLLQS